MKLKEAREAIDNVALANMNREIKEHAARFEKHMTDDLMRCFKLAAKDQLDHEEATKRLVTDFSKWLNSFESILRDGLVKYGKGLGYDELQRDMKAIDPDIFKRKK